jgi:tetratricopeptide (TPR) repeat protein
VIDVREAQSFPALARFVYGDAELGGLIAQLLKLELDAGIPVGTYTLPAKKELRRVAAEEEEVEAALRRAGEALDEGLPAKAAGFLETALALRPERADIRLRLGLAYLQAGNLEKAGPALQEAARLRPVDAEARYALGKYYRGAGDLALARQEFEAAISAGGESWSNPRASFDYAWLLGELGERQKARIAFRSFLHRYPGDPWAADAERELEELAEVPK